MKSKLMVLMLVAGGALFARTHVSIGVQIGGPAPYMVPAPPPVAVGAYQPPCPGPGYVWIAGYYDEYGNWYDGYWALPPYAGAYWVAPRYYSGRFYSGYWGGSRGMYRMGPRWERPGHGWGHERGFDRGRPGYYGNGFRDHDRGNRGGRGNGWGRGEGRGHRR